LDHFIYLSCYSKKGNICIQEIKDTHQI